MAYYAIMRIEKRKLGSVSRICNHHERLKEKYKSNPDIDHERTHLNYHIKRPYSSYRTMALKRIEESGAKRRKDSIIIQDCLVTASPEWIRSKSYEEQTGFFNEAYDFFTERFGEKNMISAVVHMDEATPHLHITFVPITKDNRLSSKDLIGGPRGLEKLQDDFYDHLKYKYPDLNRGISRRITHRKHLPPYIYKNAEILFSHYEEIVNAVNDIGLMNNSRKKENAIHLLGRYAPEMAELKTQMKRTSNYIENLEEGLELKDKSIAYKNKQIDKKDDELSVLRSKIRDLERKQKRLQKVIDKIPPSVLDDMKQAEKNRRKQELSR